LEPAQIWGTRRALGEDLLLDLLQFHLQRIDDGKVAVHHRIHQRIQHEARTMAQQFGLVLAALAHAQETALAAVAHRQHEVGAHEHIDLAMVEMAGALGLGLQQVHHGEQR
jgi:hypothetical protein